MYLRGFTPNLSPVLSYFPLRNCCSLILHAHHLNSQLPICQHVETPLKRLHATGEEIGLDIDMIIITVCWFLVVHRIPFMLFLWYQGTHSFRPQCFSARGKEIIFECSNYCVCIILLQHSSHNHCFHLFYTVVAIADKHHHYHCHRVCHHHLRQRVAGAF